MKGMLRSASISYRPRGVKSTIEFRTQSTLLAQFNALSSGELDQIHHTYFLIQEKRAFFDNLPNQINDTVLKSIPYTLSSGSV